ncbi:putative ankyrin repeat protein RF_0381 [Physella acuta]|uniref:putative ankyrin repeat protein RF_0381 n=1 Tax=Physella acuta TaxID=109671 RepID=UPI0027DBBD5F|nr:putative ankyrin repeat protein RF_0381 [Physella acuta]
MAAGGEENIVELLVHASADVNAKTKRSDSMIGSDVFLGAGKTDPIQLTEDQLCVGTQVTQTESDAYVAEEFSFPKGPTGVNLMKQTTAELEKKIHSSGGETPRPVAAESVNISSMEYLDQISTGASVNSSVLHKYIERRNIKKIHYLVQAGANVNVPNKYGKTALHYCVEYMDFESVKVLLEAGADANLQDANLQTPLHVAVRLHRNVSRGNLTFHGDIKEINKKLTQICLSLITSTALLNVSDKKGNTALHYAIQSHTIEIVQRLLDAGADVTLRNNTGKTVLHKAAKTMFVDFMAIVLNHKEVANVIDLKSNKREMHTSVARMKGSNVSDFQASYRICSSADAPTALMIAVKDQNTEVALMLLEHKADVNIRNDEGYTALHIAAEGSYTKSIKHLIKAGADVNDQTNDGESPLMLARDIEVIKTLCQAGADVNMKNKLGKNVLHKTICSDYLSETKHAYLVEYLVQYMRDINALDNYNVSALTYCLLKKQIKNTETLLKSGANSLLDTKYRYLLSDPQILKTGESNIIAGSEIIFSNGHFEYLRLLVCNGIVLEGNTLIKTLDKNVQVTSLMLSIMYQKVDVTKYLLTTGYVTVNDLRQLRQFDKSPQDLNELLVVEHKQHLSSTTELQTLIHEAVSNPWPLVKLAFITVSTMLGVSPERDERLSQTKLPENLKQRLMFQTPEAQLPVSDWSKCPLFFNPLVDEMGPEFLLHLWPIDVLYGRMKYRLEQLQRYTVGDYTEKLALHLTEDVLKASFHFRNRKEKYNELNLHDVDPLVEACIDAIDDCIFYHGNSFDVDYGPKYLILRSGLQFMIEDFESLQEEYADENSELSASVEFFDERLKSWKNNFGNIGFFENITHTAEELRRPEGIPAYHTWWFELDF